MMFWIGAFLYNRKNFMNKNEPMFLWTYGCLGQKTSLRTVQGQEMLNCTSLAEGGGTGKIEGEED